MCVRAIAFVVALGLLVGCGPSRPEASSQAKAPIDGESSTDVSVGGVSVPSLIGLDLPDALEELRRAELEPIVREVQANEPAGTVVDQNPRSGLSRLGDPVIVHVATPPAGGAVTASPRHEVAQDDTDAGEEATENPAERSVNDNADERHSDPEPSGTAGPANLDQLQLELVDSGFSWAPWGSDGAPAVSAAAVIRNPGSQVGRAFRVTYVVRDEGGNARGSATEWVRYAPPQQTIYTAYRLYLDPGPPPATLEVIIEDPAPSPVAVPPAGGFTSLRSAQQDIFGEWRNPTGETIDRWLLSCVTYSGNRVTGGGWTMTDLVPAGSSVPFRLGNGLVPGIQVDEIQCSAFDDVNR